MVVFQQWYLWDLAEADDLACVRVHGEQHGSGLRGVGLQQLQGLVQRLVVMVVGRRSVRERGRGGSCVVNAGDQREARESASNMSRSVVMKTATLFISIATTVTVKPFPAAERGEEAGERKWYE